MDNSSTSGGIGFVGLLTLIFITLKLCGVIGWSWIWVLSPIWISFIVSLIILGLIFGFGLICVLIATLLDHQR